MVWASLHLQPMGARAPRLALLALLTAAQVLAQLGKVRQVQEKTPHPCKAKYDDSEVASWVDAHLKDVPAGTSDPRLLLLLGGSGAGKGTFISKWRSSKAAASPDHPLSGFVFHGLDEYLPYIPEYRLSVGDAENVYKDAADACYSGASIPAAKLAGARIVEKKMDLIYEETGKNVDRIKKRVLPPFLDAGYKATIVLVHNKPEIAMRRSSERFQLTGRYADDDYIRGTFENNYASYQELKKHVSSAEFIFCDNTGSAMKCWADGSPSFSALIPKDMLDQGAMHHDL